MLEQITEYLSLQIEQTNYFERIFPFVEQVKRGDDKVSPEMYCGKGEYKKVNDPDHYNGMAYFRQTSAETVEQIEGIIGCKILLQIKYPLRLVAFVPKEKLTIDDAFSDERVSMTLLRYLTGEGGSVKNLLKARSISFIPYSINKNRTEILAEEYQGYDKMKTLNFKYSYHAIDFFVTVQVNSDCIVTECENSYANNVLMGLPTEDIEIR